MTHVSAAGVTTGLLPGLLGTLEELAFFHIDSVTKAAGSSSGTIDWTFSAPDLAFDYLAAGQTVTLTYTVQVNDYAGRIPQDADGGDYGNRHQRCAGVHQRTGVRA